MRSRGRDGELKPEGERLSQKGDGYETVIGSNLSGQGQEMGGPSLAGFIPRKEGKRCGPESFS